MPPDFDVKPVSGQTFYKATAEPECLEEEEEFYKLAPVHLEHLCDKHID